MKIYTEKMKITWAYNSCFAIIRWFSYQLQKTKKNLKPHTVIKCTYKTIESKI